MEAVLGAVAGVAQLLGLQEQLEAQVGQERGLVVMGGQKEGHWRPILDMDISGSTHEFVILDNIVCTYWS